MPKLNSFNEILNDSADSADLFLVYDVSSPQDDALRKMRSSEVGAFVATQAASTFKGLLSGGTGVNYDSATGVIAIDQSVDSAGTVYFGSLILSGDLTVNGTTTTLNSSTLTIDDKNIVIADNAADSAAANGGGITLNGANATITYNSSTDEWVFNKDISAPNLSSYIYTGFDSAFSGKTTDDLTEGSTNLYYSTSLFNTDFATKTIGSSQLTSAVSLVIYDSSGSAIKTLYGAGV
jgi:hypothetical protein